jgi:OmpA-OmpF porin, OOP family
MLKNRIIVISFISLMLGMSDVSFAQQTDTDGDWTKNYVSLKNTREAEYMIRVGDIDNLNCQWPENFNPFCGTSTPSHQWPTEINPNDVVGLDRIILGSSYKGNNGADGYSGSYSNETKPVPITFELKDLKQLKINKVTMQIFLDDFQAPVFGSRFTATINGKRFYNFEKILNELNQTGPIGKLVTIDVPAELLPEFSKDKVDILIDDPTTGIGDGYAIDFIKFLINPKSVQIYKGNLTGKVIDPNGNLMSDVTISLSNSKSMITKSDGAFQYNDIASGLYILTAYKRGYKTVNQNVDIECNQTMEQEISLEKAPIIHFNGQEITDGDKIVFNKIQFSAGGSELSDNSKKELDKIYQLLVDNENVEIELSGYTSSEGDLMVNKTLSLSRVEACKKYIVNKGIAPNRINTIGMGPDNPLAPNDTEDNRAKNRRVELRIVKI